MAEDTDFCIWCLLLPLLQPWAQVAELSSETVTTQQKQHSAPQNDFWLPAWQGWSSSWWVAVLDQLYPRFTCLSARIFEFQHTFLFVVPQWSNNLRFRVVLALEILVMINQVRDKAVAKTQRKQDFLKIIYLEWPVHFRNVGEEKVVWERYFLKNKLFIVMIDVIIFIVAGRIRRV